MIPSATRAHCFPQQSPSRFVAPVPKHVAEIYAKQSVQRNASEQPSRPTRHAYSQPSAADRNVISSEGLSQEDNIRNLGKKVLGETSPRIFSGSSLIPKQGISQTPYSPIESGAIPPPSSLRQPNLPFGESSLIPQNPITGEGIETTRAVGIRTFRPSPAVFKIPFRRSHNSRNPVTHQGVKAGDNTPFLGKKMLRISDRTQTETNPITGRGNADVTQQLGKRVFLKNVPGSQTSRNRITGEGSDADVIQRLGKRVFLQNPIGSQSARVQGKRTYHLPLTEVRRAQSANQKVPEYPSTLSRIFYGTR